MQNHIKNLELCLNQILHNHKLLHEHIFTIFCDKCGNYIRSKLNVPEHAICICEDISVDDDINLCKRCGFFNDNPDNFIESEYSYCECYSFSGSNCCSGYRSDYESDYKSDYESDYELKKI
jgi:hypothetical protein